MYAVTASKLSTNLVEQLFPVVPIFGSSTVTDAFAEVNYFKRTQEQFSSLSSTLIHGKSSSSSSQLIHQDSAFILGIGTELGIFISFSVYGFFATVIFFHIQPSWR